MTKISALTPVVNALLTDFLAVVQGGETRKETLQQILTLFNSNIQISETQVTNLVTDLASKLSLTGGTMTGALIGYADTPIQNREFATKIYVDTIINNFKFHASCKGATTAALTVVYSNGSSGVGATLTNNGALAAFGPDGVTYSVGDRVLIKDQASQVQNGIYTVTIVGSGAVAWVLTRATDFDSITEIAPGDFIIIEQGTTNGLTSWVQTQVITIIGTDNIIFSQFTAVPNTFLKVANNLSDVSDAPTSRANLGFRCQKHSEAGGSATVTITDADISANSVVVAVIESSANAVNIQKVTPGAGDITVLCSADPGVSVFSYMAVPEVN